MAPEGLVFPPDFVVRTAYGSSAAYCVRFERCVLRTVRALRTAYVLRTRYEYTKLRTWYLNGGLGGSTVPPQPCRPSHRSPSPGRWYPRTQPLVRCTRCA